MVKEFTYRITLDAAPKGKLLNANIKLIPTRASLFEQSRSIIIVCDTLGRVEEAEVGGLGYPHVYISVDQ